MVIVRDAYRNATVAISRSTSSGGCAARRRHYSSLWWSPNSRMGSSSHRSSRCIGVAHRVARRVASRVKRVRTDFGRGMGTATSAPEPTSPPAKQTGWGPSPGCSRCLTRTLHVRASRRQRVCASRESHQWRGLVIAAIATTANSIRSHDQTRDSRSFEDLNLKLILD